MCEVVVWGKGVTHPRPSQVLGLLCSLRGPGWTDLPPIGLGTGTRDTNDAKLLTRHGSPLGL